MSGRALGLIETRGLIGAIVATDAAAKGAAVVVTSVELTDAAFLTLKIEGDLGAVQAAVETGAEAAEKVGDLISRSMSSPVRIKDWDRLCHRSGMFRCIIPTTTVLR